MRKTRGPMATSAAARVKFLFTNSYYDTMAGSRAA
jgi:hypothetical protein